MSNLEIKQLFEFSRFQDFGARAIFSILYFPIGLILLIIRGFFVLCFIIVNQTFPDSPFTEKLLNKLASLSFGISISVDNPKQLEKVDFYITNHTSIFDQLVVHITTGSVSPSKSFTLQSVVGFGTKDFGSLSNVESFKKNIEVLFTKKRIPVHFCPEEKPTNGRALLKFNSKYFQFLTKLQPICVTVERPFLNISVSKIGSSYLSNVLYFMYSPVTNYKLKFLPSLEKKSFTDDEFAEIARQNIASELKIDTSNFTAADLTEWEKRYLAERQRQTQNRANDSYGRRPNPELLRMANQVKEVLPHVPLNVIYNDLVVTRGVDATITNILEGRIQFVPESPQPSPSSSHHRASASKSSGSLNFSNVSNVVPLSTAATSFGKTASERTKSFQERKELLIAVARRRYIEKNNLDISF
ncbi:lipid droplet-regulating VLDL assembly factor AUP1-like [Cylas formicarius]|uniref:lipid droplet-regulating VLDL assembly factor AUP1-like n=1 Tax=Cylas formicarius TaxID=197179 RepID=UPI0029587270|nr:lipid droplet-regulating VLDL assembly factor AUP1-like [Cylas formicarius]